MRLRRSPTEFECVTQVCTRAPLLEELELGTVHENWLVKIVKAIPSDKVLQKIKIDSIYAQIAVVLQANLTTRAQKVEYRAMRGPLFDNSSDGANGGI